MSAMIAATWERLREQLMADKKKAIALGVLFSVLLMVVGVQSFSKSAPTATEASDLIVVQSNTPELLRPSPAEPAPMRVGSSSSLVTAEATAQMALSAGGSSADHTVSVEGMSRRPVRDVFSTPAWAQFPLAILPESHQSIAARGKQDDTGFWGQLGKQLLAEQERRRQLSEAIDLELAEMSLQSTMTGADPLAHISGRLVRPGDAITGFSVVRIEDRRVVLKKYGVTRILRMP